MKKLTFNIGSAKDLFDVLQSTGSKLTMEGIGLVLSDGLPVTSATYVERKFEDGTYARELVLTDEVG